MMPATIAVYNSQGKKVSTLKLPESLRVEPNPKLLAQALHVIQSNLRAPIAATKTRAQVRGGGRKPWRQKGTGRARAGSIRSPLWRGGGIVFGPRADRAYRKKLPQAISRKAFAQALVDKIKSSHLIVVKEWKISALKTKEAQKFLDKLPIPKAKRVFLVGTKSNAQFYLACRNLPDIEQENAESLRIDQVLKADFIVFDQKSWDGLIQKRLVSKVIKREIKTSSIIKQKEDKAKKVKA